MYQDSDEEETKAVLADENIQQLNEAEKVMKLLCNFYFHLVQDQLL